MHILIAGGTGFIGQALTEHFLKEGHQVSILGRSKEKIKHIFEHSVNIITWKELAPKTEEILEEIHWLINLTGANIGTKKWTDERKKQLLESRIDITKYLTNICTKMGKQAPTLFCASGVGIYGIQKQTQPWDEESKIDGSAQDFLSQLGQSWEQATKPAEENGVRVVKLRFGVVLGNGGALKKMEPFYKLGLGGKIGSGKQPFSWVSLQDVIRAFDFIYQHKALSGPINLVAPAHDSQLDFAKALGKAMNRPTLMTTPPWLVQLLYGQMGDELLLHGQKVTPKKLQDENFTFECTHLETVLNPIYQPEPEPNQEQNIDPETPPKI